MIRPCFLIIDREHSGSISTRKLIAETAKYNVITAYSAREGVATLRKFPNLSGVVLDKHVKDMTCEEVIRDLKAISPRMPILLIESPSPTTCTDTDFILNRYTPEGFLEKLRLMTPVETEEIERREKELEDQE